jgi:type I restriction enzyme S subunit
LNIAVVEQDFDPEPIVSTAFAVIHPFNGIEARYLYYYLRSKPFIGFVENQMKGMAYPAINDGNFFQGLLPLPPSEEQKRIVAKVDELMKLCDKLEARQQKKREARLHLNNSALEHLLAASTPEEFSAHWQRIYDNFDLLYDTPETISKLRQSIRQLAVQGKLVPQDPNDEPAAALYERIQAEKERLFMAKKIRRLDQLEPIDPDKQAFRLPESWKWIRLDSICFQITDGTHHTPMYTATGTPFLSVKDVSGGKIDLRNTKFISREEHEKLIKRCKPEYENVLLTKVGTTGIAKVIDVDVEFSIFVSLALLKFTKEMVSPYFLELALNSPHVKEQSSKYTQGVGNKNLVIKFIKDFVLPLPPLEEQNRIVAKVDQLMNLCDVIETKLNQAQKLSESLTASMVNHIFSAAEENANASAALPA